MLVNKTCKSQILQMFERIMIHPSVIVSSISPTIFAALLGVYLCYRLLVYPALLSPLSKLPAAHVTSTFLPLWIWYKRRSGRESRSIFAAHSCQGPIVLLAPYEVSVASLDGLQTIYTGGFSRTDWFLDFRNYNGTPNLVTLFNSTDHARRKRMLSNIYSKSYLQRSADLRLLATELLFQRMLPVLRQSSEMKKGVDVFELGCAVGAEFISAYEMGIQNGLDIVRMGRELPKRKYLNNGKIKIRNLRGKEKAAKELEIQCLEMCRMADAFLDQSSSEEWNGEDLAETASKHGTELLTTYPVVYAKLRASIPAVENPKTSKETQLLIASELLDSIEAGREGIGIAVTYAMHHLSQNLVLQQSLRDEILTLESRLTYPLPQERQPLSTGTLRELDHLPLLNGVVHETLRLNAPAPGPQRRIVPKGGTILHGYYIPAGVTISTSSYSMHRNEDIYPEPEAWKPERWIAIEKGEQGNSLNRWFWAFGSGGKKCIGSNLTLIVNAVLKLVLASIYSNFETTIIDDEGIEQRDDMMAYPVGDKLILGFKYIEAPGI